MAIAYDTSTDGGHGTGATLTFSHTCTGNKRILFVAAGALGNLATATYGGVAMTQIDTESAGSIQTTFFYLKNPASGANNVIVSAAGGSISAVSASYTLALQTGGMDISGGTFGNPASSISQSLTTVTDNTWLVAGGCAAAGGVVAGSNTTVRINSGNTFGMYICDSNAARTPPGSFTIAITCTSEKVSMSAAAFAPGAILNLTISAFVGSFALTGFAVTLSKIRAALTAAVGTFALTGFAATFTKAASIWTNKTKHTTTWTNKTKH